MAEKILLVDDEKDFLNIMSERMKARGMDVFIAASAKEAIQLTEEESFDAIILDLQIPEMDGLEALKAKNPELQVILLTGHATVEQSVEAMKLGAMDLMEKPADLTTLTENIRKARHKKMILIEKQIKEKMNDKLIEAGKLASVGELAIGFAHEINNPIAIMLEEAGVLLNLFQNAAEISPLTALWAWAPRSRFICRQQPEKSLSINNCSKSKTHHTKIQEALMTEKILLVDDEEDFLNIMSERMRTRGMNVSTATSAREAIQLTEAESFDAIILDLQMPQMDGLEALKALKAKNPELQIILLTAHATVEKGIQAMKLGAMDLMEKPADLKALTEKIKKAQAKKMILVEKKTEETIKHIMGGMSW